MRYLADIRFHGAPRSVPGTSTLTSLLEANINQHFSPGRRPSPRFPRSEPDRIIGAESSEPVPVPCQRRSVLQERSWEGNDPPNVAKARWAFASIIYDRAPTRATRQSRSLDATALARIGDEDFSRHSSHHRQHDRRRGEHGPAHGAARSAGLDSVIMRQLSPEDATGFWAGDDQQVTRLSAYYEVRVIFLSLNEREGAPASSSISGLRRAVGCARSRHNGEHNPVHPAPELRAAAQTLVARPARAIIDDRAPGALPAEHRRFDLVGTNLSLGVARRIVWRHARLTHLYPRAPRDRS